MSRSTPIAVVGAGLSGLAMGMELSRAGLDDFTIFEASSALGGTWRDNTYPGCACDVPSHLYSLRRAPHRWSRFYAPQPEIRAYLEQVADDHGLRPKIAFDTTISSATFDDGWWHLEAADGRQQKARALVLALGPLSRPLIPELPGRDDFQGPAFHSMRWDHGVPLAGARVAVIGTGASAIQIVPAIAPQVGQLDLYQRSPPWLIPRRDRALSSREQALLERPFFRTLLRARMFWLRELFGSAFVRDGLMTRLIERLARAHLKAAVPDAGLRSRLTPDYAMGCKRVLVSDEYYPALQCDNVTLIDTPAAAVTAGGIIDGEGRERPADVLVYATGFRATELLSALPITAGGQTLNDAWAGGAEAYYGMAVSGFPNLYLMLGPNSGLGHNSMILMIEAQARYIRQCIARIRSEGLRSLDVLPAAQRAFNARLQRRLAGAVWADGCQSWYLDREGKNTALWPGHVWEYQLRTRWPRRRDFRAHQTA